MFNVEEAQKLLKNDPSGRKLFEHCAKIASDTNVYIMDDPTYQSEIASLDSIFTLLAECPDADAGFTIKDIVRLLNDLKKIDKAEEHLGDTINIRGLECQFATMYFMHGRGLTLPNFLFLNGSDDEGFPTRCVKWKRKSEDELTNIRLNVKSAATLLNKKFNNADEIHKSHYVEYMKKLKTICEQREVSSSESQKNDYQEAIKILNAVTGDDFQKKVLFTFTQEDKHETQKNAAILTGKKLKD